MKFKVGTTELEMLNDMVRRDMEILNSKIHPKYTGESVRMSAAYPRYIILMQHVGRHDLYEELGADVKDYGELIEKELENAAKLPLGI